MVTLRFKKIHENAIIPNYATFGSSGFDFRCIEDVVVEPGKTELIGTGLIPEIEMGYEMQIRPRSGLSIKYNNYISNSPGTVDNDFRGEIKIIITNNTNKEIKFDKGDKIAQGVICPIVQCQIIQTDDVTDTERGEGGFNSTGK